MTTAQEITNNIEYLIGRHYITQAQDQGVVRWCLTTLTSLDDLQTEIEEIQDEMGYDPDRYIVRYVRRAVTDDVEIVAGLDDEFGVARRGKPVAHLYTWEMLIPSE